MKLSWSHKLFFRANRLIGRSIWFDRAVKFWAEYALFFLTVLVLIYLWQRCPGPANVMFIFVWLPLLWLVGFGISALIGYVWPHRRPIVEFPEIRELITPLSNWKSLPSDHAFSAWLLVAAVWLGPSCSAFVLWPGLIFAFLATIISAARVFAGVHYPRDIAVGTALAWVVALLFFR